MNSALRTPTALIILDGWGFSEKAAGNAVLAAHTPNYDEIVARYPWTTIEASGEAVGLEKGRPGNAEIGHMSIGAGRVVRTAQAKIREDIRTGAFDRNETLVEAIASARKREANVHLIGLISDADVHASTDVLYALLRMAKRLGHKEAFVHAILDGRDVPPRSADTYLEAVEVKMAEIGIGRFATLCGRFYAMDSSENWERTARAFTMLAFAEGERAVDAVAAIRNSFLRGISEEFLSPIVLEGTAGVPVTKLSNGDLVIFFNHRADSMRQLVRSLAVPDRGTVAAGGKPWLESVCLTEYDSAFGVPVAYPPTKEERSLNDLFDEFEVPNLRITETDRVPHISRFLNCSGEGSGPFTEVIEVETANAVIRESEPEMQSFKITDRLLRSLEAETASVYVVNIPAPGLIAETGDLKRTVEAIGYVDTCIGAIVRKVREFGGQAIITSSYGNCESMLDGFGNPSRTPTSNAVPVHVIGNDVEGVRLRKGGALCDVAPTLLGMLGLGKPAEMSGVDLRF